MATNRYYPEGDSVKLVADQAYASGEAVAIGQITGVAVTAVETGGEFAVHTNGAWRFNVEGALTVGQAVYLNARKLTGTKSGKPFGVALQAKAAGTAEAIVRPYGYTVPTN